MLIYVQMYKHAEQNGIHRFWNYKLSDNSGMFQNENVSAARLTKMEESCYLIEKSSMPRECSAIKVSFHFYASDIFVCMFCFLFSSFALLCFVF